jgi:hypothetical protein
MPHVSFDCDQRLDLKGTLWTHNISQHMITPSTTTISSSLSPPIFNSSHSLYVSSSSFSFSINFWDKNEEREKKLG